MDVSLILGILVLLALLYYFNGWWIKKIILSFQVRDLNRKRLSPAVQEVDSLHDKGDEERLFPALQKLSRDEIYEWLVGGNELSVDLMSRYSERFGKCPEAFYLHGTASLNQAWKERGGGPGNSLTQKQRDGFLHYLKQADKALRTALELDPAYGDVYGSLIRCQMGLGLREEGNRWFLEAKKVDPGRLDYALAMLSQRTPKWGGSRERMFAFAMEDDVGDNPVCRAGLIAAAHYECWQSLENQAERGQYYRQTKVREQLLSAYNQLLKNPLSPQAGFRERYQHLLALNVYSLTFLFMNEKGKAKKAFKKIGRHYTALPWVYRDEVPLKAYLEARKLAGLAML